MTLKTTQEALNSLAGTTDRTRQGALNILSGEKTTAQESANTFAGTSKLSIQDALNTRAGTTGLSAQEAANKLEDLTTLNTLTPTSIKGGVLRCIDEATGDIARTTSGWIEDEKYGWYALAKASAMSAEFDSAVQRTGSFTLKLSTIDVTGRVFVMHNFVGEPGDTETVEDLSKYAIQVKPSTEYRLSCYVKTTNTTGAQVAYRIYDASGTRNATTSSATAAITGTNDWTLNTKTFTTGATDVYIVLFPAISAAGNISDAWFDVNSMTLEEVSSIDNTGSVPALFYPKVTAVSSTDNIDQSQVVSNTGYNVGTLTTLRVARAQQFLPTKRNLTGIVMKKGTAAGTYAGDITFSIQATTSNLPSGTNLVTSVMSADTYNAIPNDTEFTVSLPYTITIDGSTKYWIVITSSTTDDTNYVVLSGNNTDVYTSGLNALYDTMWKNNANVDFYFKTLYSKNTTNFTVRTDTEEVSVTAPTQDGWANGTVIDTKDEDVTPLTLAAGANDIYFASNGSGIADGEVDPSLQCTISGTYLTQ